MSGFACQECGHKFKTIAAAERASFGPNGCPKCGSSDIDLGAPQPVTAGACCLYHATGGVRACACGDDTAPMLGVTPEQYSAAVERVKAAGGRLPMGAR